WIAEIPSVCPVHSSRRGSSTWTRVDLIVPGPAFQENVDPSANNPSSRASVTSGFHAGQRAIVDRIAQTVPGPASISIVPETLTGAEASTVMVLKTRIERPNYVRISLPPPIYPPWVDGTRRRKDEVLLQMIPR